MSLNLVLRIVVPYNETMLIHIGTRNMSDLLEIPTANSQIGLPTPAVHTELSTIEECIAAAAMLSWRDGEGPRQC